MHLLLAQSKQTETHVLKCRNAHLQSLFAYFAIKKMCNSNTGVNHMHIHDIMIETYLTYIKCKTVKSDQIAISVSNVWRDSIELPTICYGLFPPLTRQFSITGDDSAVGTPYF